MTRHWHGRGVPCTAPWSGVARARAPGRGILVGSIVLLLAFLVFWSVVDATAR